MQTTETALAGMPEDSSAFEQWRSQGETVEAPAVETPGAAAEEQSEQPAESADESGASDDTAQSEEEKTTDEGEAERKPKGGFQRRISQLTREKRELAERLALLQSGQAGDKSAAPQAEATTRQEDFKDWDEFQDALTGWKVEQKLQAREAEQQKLIAQHRERQLTDSWAQREDAVREAISDYDEVMETAADVPVSPHVLSMLLASEHGPQLAYWLAKNRDVALQSMPVIRHGSPLPEVVDQH